MECFYHTVSESGVIMVGVIPINLMPHKSKYIFLSEHKYFNKIWVPTYLYKIGKLGEFDMSI